MTTREQTIKFAIAKKVKKLRNLFLLQHCALKPFKFKILNSQIAVKIHDGFRVTVAALHSLRTIRLRNVLKNDIKGGQIIYFDFFNTNCKN